jgi:hypothetical protein
MLTLAVGWSSCRFCDYFVVKVTIYMYIYCLLFYIYFTAIRSYT